MNQEKELPALAGLAACLFWLEELLNIINGPVLLFGAGIALVDLLTDGQLTATAPVLLFAWAVSQALGIDTQLLGAFSRASDALRRRAGWSVLGWLVLGALLGFAAWQAGYVFAVQQAEHISEAAALVQLHLVPAVWLGWRAFLAVLLVALSGWTRYHKPVATLADERAELERELMLTPLRQRLANMRAVGVVQTARNVGEAAMGRVGKSRYGPKPPTGGGSPAAAPREGVPADDDARGIVALAPRDMRTTRRGVGRALTLEARIRRVAAKQPGLGKRQVARLVGCSESQAGRILRRVREEQHLAATRVAQ